MLTGFGQVIVVWLGGRLVYNQLVPLPDLVAFLLYIGMFYHPVQILSRVNEDLQNAMASAERVFNVLETVPEVQEAPDAQALTRVKGRVTFSHVDFHYTLGQPVLKDINLDVQPGETIAVVGPTGVGKTTLVSLIPRFYDPVAGNIAIDGIDIRRFTLASLRSQISLVLQDVFLFNGTVLENIVYGRPDATREEVIEAAKAACAHEFITGLPQRYDTPIGERGVKLSGGQKQRLSIARAILRDSPILILDEATSSVDTHTERTIQQALANVTSNRTTFVIAHRLSTVKRADRIIVLSDGVIAEQGTHEQLLQQSGIYAALCAVQFADEEEPVFPAG
jgi:ATP-binding cassette subfamily B protein